MKRKDYTSGTLIGRDFDDKLIEYRKISTYTLNRWKRKAKIIASIKKDLLDSDTEWFAYGLAQDILKVLK